MSAETYGDESRVILCSKLSGSGSSVTYSNTVGEKAFFIRSKEASFSFGYNSRISELANAKTRSTPDMKYSQKYIVSNGKFRASDANALHEWLSEVYFQRKNIYMIVQIPSGSGGWVNKSFYNGNRTKIYYMQGRIQGDLRITQAKGQIWNIAFTFTNLTN